MNFTTSEWILAVAAALLVGVSKTGIAGMGMLFVVIFAQILPAKQATGLVLPLLCSAIWWRWVLTDNTRTGGTCGDCFRGPRWALSSDILRWVGSGIRRRGG